MPIRPELRPLYPPHWRALSNYVRFERAAVGANAVDDRTSHLSADFLMGGGLTSKQRPGGTAKGALPGGPTL